MDVPGFVGICFNEDFVAGSVEEHVPPRNAGDLNGAASNRSCHEMQRIT